MLLRPRDNRSQDGVAAAGIAIAEEGTLEPGNDGGEDIAVDVIE